MLACRDSGCSGGGWWCECPPRLQAQRLSSLEKSLCDKLDDIPQFLIDKDLSLDLDFCATPFVMAGDAVSDGSGGRTTVPPSVPTVGAVPSHLRSRSLRLVSMRRSAAVPTSDPPATASADTPAPAASAGAISSAVKVAPRGGSTDGVHLKRVRSSDVILDWGTPSNVDSSPHPEKRLAGGVASVVGGGAPGFEALNLLLSQVPDKP